MDKKKNGIPKLRFPGFTGAWEQRKLGEMSHIETGKLDANAMVKNGKYDFYTSGIKKYHIDTPAFKGPAITIAGNGATVGYMHLADGEFNAYQRTYVLTKFSANRSFIFMEIGNKLPRKIQQESRAGNIPYIVMDMLTDLKIVLPSLAEQEKIGNFFNELNFLIALHQRKLDHLKEQKKGLLQRMFPKKGEVVPEVRFPGFTNAWEQRKFGELFDSISDKGYPELPVLSASQEEGMVYRSTSGYDIMHSKENEIGYKRVKPGDFVIHLRSFQGGFAGSTVEGITSPAYTVIRFKSVHEQDFNYWKNVFTSKLFIDNLVKVTYGIRDGRSISFSDFKQLKWRMPSFDEQKKIGLWFEELNDLIALHQRKLDHLKLLKKGLLQQMFV